jgi:SPP1 gp7 family putative phage head morphogenesis protein
MEDSVLNALVAAGILDKETADIIRNQSDPAAARTFAEDTLTTTTHAALQAQQGRLLDVVDAAGGRPTTRQMDRLWAGENDLLWNALRPALLDIASERAAVAALGAVAGAGVDVFNLINRGVLSWVEDYYIDPDGLTYGSIPNLNLAGRTMVQRAFTAWQLGELEIGDPVGLQQLIDALSVPFGIERAKLIASTEVTRIFSQAELFAARANEFTTHLRWLTANDGERVCIICAPLHGQVVEKNSGGFPGVGWPPAHSRCRCALSPETEQTLTIPFRG